MTYDLSSGILTHSIILSRVFLIVRSAVNIVDILLRNRSLTCEASSMYMAEFDKLRVYSNDTDVRAL